MHNDFELPKPVPMIAAVCPGLPSCQMICNDIKQHFYGQEDIWRMSMRIAVRDTSMFSVEAVEVAAEKKMFIFSNQLCVFCVVLPSYVIWLKQSSNMTTTELQLKIYKT